jgi:ADP-ribose pyrophosphatase YjhB (NUDIX family)/DNA-directed RNA polymerase subunit RPC12/RpoP
VTDQFCSQCGATMVARLIDGRKRLTCAECGHVAFVSCSLSAGGLLICEEKVLLIQRGTEPNKGLWTLPGGYVEIDETPDQAVVREVTEETGLETRADGLIGLWSASRENRQTVYCVFRLGLTGAMEQLKANGNGDEIQQARFVDTIALDSLGKVGRIAHWFATRHSDLEDTALYHTSEQPRLFQKWNTSAVFGPRLQSR